MLVILLGAFAPSMRDSERSQVMLMGIGFFGMVVTQLSGCFFTADCVSSEKREGTLGLLFLTPLKSLDIVLGKLASHSLLVFFSMLALAPVLFIPVLNGGITGIETIRMMIALIVSLFLSLSVGLFVSCAGRDVKTTVTGTFVVMALLNAIPVLYLFICAEVFRMNVSPYGVPQFGPWTLPIFAIDEMTSRFGVKLFWIAAGLQTAMGSGFLVAATFVLRRIARRGDYEWKAAVPAAAPRGWKRAWRWVTKRSELKKTPLGNRQPYYWAAARGWSEVCWIGQFRRLMWFGAAFFLFLALASRRSVASDGFWSAFWLAALLHLFTKFTLILEATRQLSEDRRSGCLELILSTPFDPQWIVDGAVKGAGRVFRLRFAILPVLNAVLLFLALGLGPRYYLRGDELFLTCVALVGGAVFAGWDYRTILWRGSLAAMRRKTHLWAALDTAFFVMVAPWLVAALLLMMLAMARADESALGVTLVVWFVCCFIYNSWLARRARRALYESFRTLAAH